MNQKTLDLIAQTLFDKKAANILVLDVRSISGMTDYFIVAEGNVARHVRALGQAVIDALEEEGIPLWSIEGKEFGDWEVLDFGDAIIHLFGPELREKYQLESLWRDATIVNVHIDIPK
ncbi:MAG: ribosome silencing factor [Chlamydiia bacterium]|nr:ribosome silencing factor [Chlamydiia bacterium]